MQLESEFQSFIRTAFQQAPDAETINTLRTAFFAGAASSLALYSEGGQQALVGIHAEIKRHLKELQNDSTGEAETAG